MITGDNALVAKSLALQIGVKDPKILTGADMQKMSNTGINAQGAANRYFCRSRA